MAAINRSSTHPNILHVTRIDSRSEYRDTIRGEIHGSATSPVRRGTHDFWICCPTHARPDCNPNFGHGDLGARSAGRPLRGIAEMCTLPPAATADIRNWIFTAIHELGHSWLVPSDLRIRLGGNDVDPLHPDDITWRLDREQPFERPALLARQDSHWSCYVNFGSCMDSLDWVRNPASGGMMRWIQQTPRLPQVRPRGLPGFEASAVFSDLDLYLMGVKRAEDCFPETGGQFFWLEPKLSRGPPMQYHAGLFIAFSRTDFFYFGFYNSHDQLRVERSGTSERSATVAIGPAFDPLRFETNAMMLRIVKTGTRYLFQAYSGNNAVAAPVGSGAVWMFDDLGATRTSGDFRQWQTVATFDAAGAQPQAMGIINKTFNPGGILVETQVFTFDVRSSERNRTIREFDIAPRGGTIPFSELPSDRLVAEVPIDGALFRRSGQSQIMGVPYARRYDHWSHVDEAPKMLMRAPAGDFVVGASVKVRRSLVSPWAGGAAAGMTMEGIERSAQIRDVVVPSRIRDHWARSVGGPVTFKTAFISVGQFTPTAEEVARMDTARRYFDAALAIASGGLVASDSQL